MFDEWTWAALSEVLDHFIVTLQWLIDVWPMFAWHSSGKKGPKKDCDVHNFGDYTLFHCCLSCEKWNDSYDMSCNKYMESVF